jgi:hypothetical protein
MCNKSNNDPDKTSHNLPSIHNHVVSSSAKVKVSNYIDATRHNTSIGYDPNIHASNEHNPDHMEDTLLAPLPHQEQLEEYSNKLDTTQKILETKNQPPKLH